MQFQSDPKKVVPRVGFIFYKYLTMKYKKELRWLVFLLVPFFIFLTIHLILPVTFVLNSYPIFQDYEQYQKYQQEQTTVRTNTFASQNIITNFLQSFVNNQQTIFNIFVNPSPSYMSINTTSISMNNAYSWSQTITQQSLDASTTENKSMWFSTGVENISQLSTEQQALINQYKRIDPFIRNMLFEGNTSFVHTFSLYATSNTTRPIYFQYPSRYSTIYSNLYAQTIDSFYYNTITAFDNSNRSFISLPFVEYDDVNNISLLSLCSANAAISFSLVACVKIDLDVLGRYAMDNQLFIEGVGFNSSLVISNDILTTSAANPQIVIEYDNTNSSTYNSPQNQTINITEKGLPSQVFSWNQNNINQNIYITTQGQKTYYISPIQLTPTSISLHLVTTYSKAQQHQIISIVQQTVKQLLIPVIILIILASIISIIVMKTLLNSIDLELYELEHRLGFIGGGDINIQIPQHQGTEDIKDLYDVVRIINKLHRYSTQHYFRGYFTQKILKYNQALQFIKSLGYDTGNVLQNMGEAAMWAQDWQVARSSLKESVAIQMKKMEDQFGTLDDMMPLKKARKVPHKYKEMQVILIRKIFKLNFIYFRYLELKQIFTYKDADEARLDEINFKKKQEELMKQATHYSTLQKKVFYPDFSSYSQCILTLLNQCKQYSNLGKLQEASQLIDKTTKIIEKYNAEYNNTTKMLKQKGSKHKLLRMRNKLTTHSRSPPDIMKTFRNLFKAKITVQQSKNPGRFLQVIHLLTEGSKVSLFTAALTYLTQLDIRKSIIELNIDPEPFETTQNFRQSLPWKSLHYGPISKQDEASFLRFPTRFSPGLQRQFVFIFDCSKQYLPEQRKKLIQYQQERTVHIFQRLVKKTDRMSIIKHGTKIGVQVHCGLILKEYDQKVLQMNLDESIKERNPRKQEIGIIEALWRAVNRTKHLKSQKVIIMFFRHLNEYKQQFKKFKKRKTKYSNKTEQLSQNSQSYAPSAFGTAVQEILQLDDLRNVKLILYTSNGEEHQKFRQFFNLDQINRRIWSKFGGINKWNNTVYVIEQKHKIDIDRLLMLKAQYIAQNHAFFL